MHIEKLRQVKFHVQKHKKEYAIGAGCLGAGYALRGGTPHIVQMVKPKALMIFGYKSSQTLTTLVMAAKGDPGDVVMRLSDNEKWPSKGELARQLGVSRAIVSKYFAGEIADILGEQYKVVGKAGHEIRV